MTRTFETGASRNKDEGKLDFEAFFSPAVLKRRAEFMHKNRKLEDGTLRDGDNWQKLFGEKHFDVCMKSMTRHFTEVWLHHRGEKPVTDEDLETALCALMFNCEAYLFALLKKK